MKRMISALVIAGSVLIPVGVYATGNAVSGEAAPQSQAESKFGLADHVYGSFAELKQAIPSTTMEDYKRFNDKLTAAKAQLGDAEYAKFEALLKQLGNYTKQFHDDKGNLDTSKMNAEQLAAFEQLMGQLQPYFEQLNK